jgi:hypothetical protein
VRILGDLTGLPPDGAHAGWAPTWAPKKEEGAEMGGCPISTQTTGNTVARSGKVAALALGLAQSRCYVWVVLPSTSASLLADH